MKPESLLLRRGRVLTPDGWLDDADVLVDNGTIAAVGRGLAASAAREIDVRERLVAPGFIDVHIHGAGGAMCESGDAEEVRTISRALTRFGVTGFLATIATMPFPTMKAAVAAVASVAGGEAGARILGIHLEGPCLNPLRAGAQMVSAMRALDADELDELQETAGGRVRLVTLAPEVEGGMELLAEARRRGIAVSVGHSNATEAEMLAAIRAGATHVTHLFNAMRELHHREPGVLGVALTEDGVSTELICDGHHLAPRIVELALRCKPPGKAVLVSDAVAALGLPDGDCEMFGVQCRIEGGAVRLRHGGQLAGSCLRLDTAVRNVRRWMPRLPLEDILRAASTSAAAVIGDFACGRLAAGCIGDIVVLDTDLEVVATICRGCPVWER